MSGSVGDRNFSQENLQNFENAVDELVEATNTVQDFIEDWLNYEATPDKIKEDLKDYRESWTNRKTRATIPQLMLNDTNRTIYERFQGAVDDGELSNDLMEEMRIYDREWDAWDTEKIHDLAVRQQGAIKGFERLANKAAKQFNMKKPSFRDDQEAFVYIEKLFTEFRENPQDTELFKQSRPSYLSQGEEYGFGQDLA